MDTRLRTSVLALIVAALLALGVAACGSSTGSGGIYNDGGAAASPASS
jgi:hypothetical protein